MENELIADLVKVCKVLQNYGIEYLIVGGTAVALHGYFRITMDGNEYPMKNMILIFGIILRMEIISAF